MAIACLRLLTLPPLPPLPERKVPRFLRRIALSSVFRAALPYLRLDFFRELFFFVAMGCRAQLSVLSLSEIKTRERLRPLPGISASMLGTGWEESIGVRYILSEKGMIIALLVDISAQQKGGKECCPCPPLWPHMRSEQRSLEAYLGAKRRFQIIMCSAVEVDLISNFGPDANPFGKHLEAATRVHCEIRGPVGETHLVGEASSSIVIGDAEVIEADFPSDEKTNRAGAGLKFGPE